MSNCNSLINTWWINEVMLYLLVSKIIIVLLLKRLLYTFDMFQYLFSVVWLSHTSLYLIFLNKIITFNKKCLRYKKMFSKYCISYTKFHILNLILKPSSHGCMSYCHSYCFISWRNNLKYSLPLIFILLKIEILFNPILINFIEFIETLSISKQRYQYN